MDGVGVARIRPYSETRAKKVIPPLREEKCPFRPDIYGIQRISCTSLELVAQYCFIFVAMLPRKRLICGCAPESDASAGCRRSARKGSAEGPSSGPETRALRVLRDPKTAPSKSRPEKPPLSVPQFPPSRRSCGSLFYGRPEHARIPATYCRRPPAPGRTRGTSLFK